MTSTTPTTKTPGAGAALVLVALAAARCGSPDASPDATAGPLYSCAAETRAVPYAPNLTRTSASGAFKAILLASVPAPPSRGSDAWTVKIVDANDVGQDGLLLAASPFMPDHGHPSTVKAVVTPLGGGEYSLTPLYLYMPGYWEVTITLRPPTGDGGAPGAADSVMFPICIPG
jgi:hypothetical protein